jgi:sec-independent protein translocase protein TatC
MFFAFGIAFEIPIATILLIMTGITSVASLSGKRPYIFVGCFVIGMLVTPPDVISQTILALPMYLLFEVGIFFGRLVEKNKADKTSNEASSEEEHVS